MNRFSLALICLFITTSYVKSSDDNSLTKEEIFALTRDGLSRDNPDALLNGYFAAWPAILYILSAVFLVMTVVSFFAYAVGICKSPRREFQTIVA